MLIKAASVTECTQHHAKILDCSRLPGAGSKCYLEHEYHSQKDSLILRD